MSDVRCQMFARAHHGRLAVPTLSFVLLLLTAHCSLLTVFAQGTNARNERTGTGAPAGACSVLAAGYTNVYVDRVTGNHYNCIGALGTNSGTWVLNGLGGGGGGGTPGGANTQIQFNDSSAFGGSANLTFVKGDGSATTASLALTGTALSNNASGNGANATDSFDLIGTVGQATSFNNNGSKGGTGALVSLLAGSGGANSDSNTFNSSNHRAGFGGAFTITSGAGGAATSATGVVRGGLGGALNLSGGVGGSSAGPTFGGDGGAFLLVAGNGGTASNATGTAGNGGSITIDAGAGGAAPGGGTPGSGGLIGIGTSNASTITVGNSGTQSITLTATPTSGNAVAITAPGTGAASNTKTGLNVATSGANAASAQTTYGLQVSNTSTGTTSSNIGISSLVSGGASLFPVLFGPTGATPAIASSAMWCQVISGFTRCYLDRTGSNIKLEGDGIFLGSGSPITFQNNVSVESGAADAGIARNAAGIVEINNGTPGVFAALKLTTVNGNTFTTGTYTLTGAAAKTLTFNNSLTLAGTDATTMTFPATSATIARTDAANTFTGASTGTSWTMTTPVIAGGLTASGSGANTFAGSTGTFLTSTGAVTIGPGAVSITGVATLTPPARSSGVASYFTLNIPADTAQTAATESIGYQHVTATRQWATTGTVALQRENFFAGPTYSSASPSQTFTDAFTLYATPPVQGTNAIFTRGHTLGIVDATSAASSITGGFIVATTLGTSATSVGIGGGNVNAGGNGTFGGTLSVTGHATLEGVTSTGATGTGKFVFDTTPTFTTSIISPLFRSTAAKVLFQGTGAGASQLASTQTTVPTCTTNCGTSPSVAGSDSDMLVTMGTAGAPASGWVVTFNGTWAAAPACFGQMALTGMANTKLPIVIATTTTTLTVTTNGAAPAISDKYFVFCRGTQ